MWSNPFEELQGRRVLITGSSSGIGAAAARAFAECGATVSLHYSSRREDADALATRILAQGGHAFALEADLAVPGAGTALTEAAIAAMGGIDVLINNAGAPYTRVAIDRFNAEQVLRIIQLNELAVIETIRAALPHFRRQGRGCIVNTTSIAARNGGGFGVSLYAAAKGGIEALSRSVAREEGAHGIRVNCVAPGYIATPIHDVTSAEQLQRYVDATPLARAGSPEDCVGAFLFLACDRLSGFVTGQTVGVNGGMHLI
ncbi:SDR family oxidoreductase [Ramlibacter sp. RBP-2]|uniref:SDR family oxidoreductase n=1 Tax=Ramlibacter lithotrophicus TaxID=2606681 RepID=A0A7X6I6M3_9BURK|nr:SDR family NAD(P)-dependent oxidoreductase [Ramlibacter lithotrophicus]NKE66385.1 SDR family oxidoreductase [Ramlibacter lithotrophicus]